MSNLEQTRFIERLAFFNGQSLFASDMEALHGFTREMRWLHNRSLHQAGVGRGLAVSGEKDAREVEVGPGYALNMPGQEIILTRAERLPVPPVAGDGRGGPAFFDLTIAFPLDDDLEEAETRQGFCETSGAVRLQEQPVFCWVRLAKDEKGNLQVDDTKLKKDIADGMKIVLARIEVLQCKLNKKVSIAHRRSARPPELPRIACGTATPTWEHWWSVWDFWLPVPAGEGTPGIAPLLTSTMPIITFGLKATIDTASAGFLAQPWYTARIEGERLLRLEMVRGDEAATLEDCLCLDQAHVGNAQKGRFTIYLSLAIVPFAISRGAQLSRFAPAITAYQACLGVEPDDKKIEACRSTARGALNTAARQLVSSEFGWEIAWMGVEG